MNVLVRDHCRQNEIGDAWDVYGPNGRTEWGRIGRKGVEEDDEGKTAE